MPDASVQGEHALPTGRLRGTGRLIAVALRRDRVLALAWLLGFTAINFASAFATADLYPTVADRIAAARLINSSPAIVALYGPILDVESLGETAMTKTTVLYAVFLMLLAMMLVRRHTRSEEETGRADLVGAAAVGSAAPLVAALLSTGLIVVLIGAVSALASIVGGLPVVGSLAFGAMWTGCGLVGAGIGAVACQLSPSTRTCGTIGAAAIGVLYLMRAVGDTGPVALSWASPLGWNTRFSAWSEPRWWLLAAYAAVTALLTALALLLRSRRDLGSGLLTDRPGPATGRLASPLALEGRLQRTALLTWTVGSLVMGTLFGSIVPNLGGLFDSPSAQEALEQLGGRGAMEDAMMAALLAVNAIVLTGYGLQVAAAAGAAEHDGLTEQVLATGQSRTRVFASVVAVALAGTCWLLAVTGVGGAIGLGSQTGELGAALGSVPAAAVGHAPAVWVVVALGILAWTVGPRWTWAGWALLTVFVTIGELGPLLRLPDWAIDLSPYQHIPHLPLESWAPGPAAALLGIAAALLAAAWWRYTRRDIG